MMPLLRAAALACAWLATLPAHAAPPPAEVFFKDPGIIDAVLSPSGRKLAVRGFFGGERVGLGVFDLSPGGKARRTAQFDDGDISRAYWVNDDRLLFNVSDFSEGSGRPGRARGLFAINPDGSEMQRLSHGAGYSLLTVPRPQQGAPNEEILVAEQTGPGLSLQTPLWLNTRNGRTRSTGVSIPPDTVGWMADSRGELRVAMTRRDSRQSALWRAPGRQDWQPLYESDLLNAPFGISAVDDAGQLYVTHAEGKDGTTVLSLYDFENRAPGATPLVRTPGFDFAGRVLNDAAGSALGVRIVTDAESTVWQNAAMQALQKEADERMPGLVNSITCRRCGQPDLVALVRSYSDREPGQYWLYQAQPPDGEPKWRQIGRTRNEIKPAEMAQMDLHRIRARDGRDLPVWVTKNPDATDPLPAVVLVHGGPWVRGNVWGWHSQAQFLASRGYAVIEPEFRGSTGYGRAHLRAGFRQFGQAMQDDVADALKWAQKQGIASDKACIAGASYGGYSTLMGLIKDPELYRCGVAWVAVTDLDLYVAGSWWVRDDIPEWGRQFQLRDMVGDPEKDAALIAAHSPVKQAARIKAPVMLAFGEADQRVPLAHGERMRRALREAGNEPVWVSYAGEGHGFAVLKNRVDFAERMAAFLGKHLQP